MKSLVAEDIDAADADAAIPRHPFLLLQLEDLVFHEAQNGRIKAAAAGFPRSEFRSGGTVCQAACGSIRPTPYFCIHCFF
jgi:hypothetical protein